MSDRPMTGLASLNGRVENYRTHNRVVAGSNPAEPTKLLPTAY